MVNRENNLMLKRFWHESGNQFTRSEVKKMVDQYGPDILIGGDPGWGDSFDTAMAACDEFGAKKHVYLVGPGMMDWSAEEREEIKRNARSVGIDTSSSNWQKKWYKEGGWEKKIHVWFKDYDDAGYYSAEIDNLDGVWDQDPDEYVQFIERFEHFQYINSLKIKLMVKNLSPEQLEALIDYNPKPETLCEWGLFEAGTGSATKQMALAAKLGIVAVTPKNGIRDTHNYGTTRKGIPALTLDNE